MIAGLFSAIPVAISLPQRRWKIDRCSSLNRGAQLPTPPRPPARARPPTCVLGPLALLAPGLGLAGAGPAALLPLLLRRLPRQPLLVLRSKMHGAIIRRGVLQVQQRATRRGEPFWSRWELIQRGTDQRGAFPMRAARKGFLLLLSPPTHARTTHTHLHTHPCPPSPVLRSSAPASCGPWPTLRAPPYSCVALPYSCVAPPRPAPPHLVAQLVGEEELAGVELVEQQHLDALRALPQQRLAPQAARERGLRGGARAGRRRGSGGAVRSWRPALGPAAWQACALAASGPPGKQCRRGRGRMRRTEPAWNPLISLPPLPPSLPSPPPPGPNRPRHPPAAW